VSAFEYVLVMVGVVLTLATSHLLIFLATVIARRERIQGYALHYAWTLLLLVLNLHTWLALWAFHTQTGFPLTQLIAMLSTASLVFIAARVLVPDLPADRRADLRSHYFRIRVPFFAILSLFWLLLLLGPVLLGGTGLAEPVVVHRAVFLGLSVSGVLIRQPAWHAALALFWGIGLASGLLLFHRVVS
jgi:hypothetical protein